MARPRKVKKYAGVDVIKLEPSDRRDMGWDYEQEVDIEDVAPAKKKRGNKK